MLKRSIAILLVSLCYISNLYCIRGPQIISPCKNKNPVSTTLDIAFTWKGILKPEVTYEIKIAEDPEFTTHLIQLKTSFTSVYFDLPYFEKGKSYYWTVRALYMENQVQIQTNWAHDDKKDRSYFQFSIYSETTGNVGYQPVNIAPENNSTINTLQPDFKWTYPKHTDANYFIKNINDEWVSPKLENIIYNLTISTSKDFQAESKTFEITNDSMALRLTIPWLKKGTKYYWRIKAIYKDPEKTNSKETEWSAFSTNPKEPSVFQTSAQAKGSFGFNAGQKEEMYDRPKLRSVEKLTSGNNNCFAPAVSKDGQKLSYCSDKYGQTEIYEISLTDRLTGSGTQKTVSKKGKFCFNPFWLYNNSDVAFYSNRMGEFWHLFSTTKGTGVTIRDGDLDIEESQENFELFGSCSSDGKIVYTGKMKNSDSYDLYLLDIKTNSKSQLRQGMFPDISNDDRIVYAYSPDPKAPDDLEIAVGNLEVNGIVDNTIITNDPSKDYDPVFSPDGARIAFVSTRSGNSDIWVMDSDGNNLSQLTYHPMVDRRPQWINNETIVFQSNRDVNEKNEHIYNIFRIKAPK
jgi:Tol biopolymer transport system component